MGKGDVEVDEIVRHIKKFLAFDILGITEKELGKNLMDRLKSLAKLRLAMDREEIRIPIHVWGGLDPINTPLYFFAGAEIFDGISWLRYAYVDGVAVYRDSYSILMEEIETPQDQARALAMSHNLTVLRGLSTSFRDFVLNREQASRCSETARRYLKKPIARWRLRFRRLKEVNDGWRRWLKLFPEQAKSIAKLNPRNAGRHRAEANGQ